MLGNMYAVGLAVPRDYIHAHMWLDLSAARSFEEAPSKRDSLTRKMTEGQIAEAQKLAREWRPKPEATALNR